MDRSYGHPKKEILNGLEDMELLANQRNTPHLAAYLKEIKDKLNQDKFNLVVLGEFKRGKTTFINALLGAALLPSAVVPLTSIVTLIQYGDNFKAEVFFLNGEKKELPLSEIADYVTEEGNPKNEKKVKLVQLEYPSEYLRDGMLLIDTPGVGSIYNNNTDQTYNYLPMVDAAIFLLSSDQPLSQTECEFLSKVKQYSAKTFFILNKIDYLDEKERSRAIEFTKKALEELAGFKNINLIPLSAKMALEGKLLNDDLKYSKSNLPEFTSILTQFLLTEKGIAALNSACSKGITASNELLLGIELETKALLIPLEDLHVKIGLFNKMVENVVQEQEDNKYILQGEMKKAYHALEQEITNFKETQTILIERMIDNLYQEKKNLSAIELLKFLRSYIESSVRKAFESWQPEVEEKVRTVFERVVARFTDKTNTVIGELLRQSAEIFELSIEGFTTMEAVTNESKLYYIIGDEAPMIFPETLKISAFFLPKFIAGPMILREMKKKTERELDRNCGRVRTDFNDRILKSANNFKKAFEAKFSMAVDGTRTVLLGAVDKRQKSKEEVDQALANLSKQKDFLKDIKNRLAVQKQGDGSLV